ncbi:hypothetical protein PQU92_16220 [Asticcacaulis sp. BYS171W]|uniref:Uncharacterized protein n=1 Tax=Asticcacaulis aquaticus TaxID=2984212 RepID=A0ABT5HZH6_9CAUL|nr:hypothetical protein [Asticcacaulis aquaticus]MDC7684831.1 hypothetical protein [Asticcacaulis aquaticus]
MHAFIQALSGGFLVAALSLGVLSIGSVYAQVPKTSDQTKPEGTSDGITPQRHSDDVPPKQTLEGAQRFLSEVAYNGGIAVEIPLRNGQYNLVEVSRDKYDCPVDKKTGAQVCHLVPGVKEYTEQTLAPLPTENAVFAELCLTQFTLARSYAATSDVPKETMVDWRKVLKAEVKGNVVNLSGVPIKFHLSSPELATRFAYTAVFMQKACDPKQRTGF